MVKQRYIVSGKVQNVGYRYWALHNADELELNGWVRNLPNSSVELLAEGELSSLIEFEKRLRKGPLTSKVSEVTLLDIYDDSIHNNFSIIQ